MPNFQNLRPLAAGLPKLVVLSTIVWGPVERICGGLIAAGLDVKILCLSATKRFYSEYGGWGIERHLLEIRDKGRPLFNKCLTLAQIKLAKYPDRIAGLDRFFFDIFDVNLGINLAEQPDFADAGLVLVCTSGLVDWESSRRHFMDKVIAWWMPFSMPFTGYCGYHAGCEKWKSGGCEKCPQLGPSVDGKDLAADIFMSKRRGVAGLHMAAVTPSQWLGECARDSLLFKAFPQVTIPTSVKLDVYAPLRRAVARSLFNLPADRKIILSGAGYLHRRNKGFHVLCEALALLQGQWRDRPPLLCFFGKEPPLESLPAGYEYRELGYLDDVTKLATAYSAADVFVSPSFQDNLPNTVNEALSCGTPVVCFNEYSSEDVVLDGITGYTAEHPGLPYAPDGTLLQDSPYSVPPEKLASLVEKIKTMVELPEDEYLAMRARCREHALNCFSPVLQAARYLRLFRRMLGMPEVSIDGLPE
jgi:glycosyltransferase involved in cell wall biosynthesis